MTDPIVYGSVHVIAAATIDQLNHVVGVWESNVGPLVSMKIDNAETLLRFKAQIERPQPACVIARQVAGHPQVPAGATLVTSGQVYIEGDVTLCAATRGASAE